MHGYGFAIDELFELGEYHDKIRICIYDDNLKIPVFHILDADEYNDTCICLFKPNYYQYNKKVYKYQLEYYNIDSYLREIDDSLDNGIIRTRWDSLVYWWKSNNKYSYLYDDNLKQPDYTKLDENKIIKRSLARTLVAKWYA